MVQIERHLKMGSNALGQLLGFGAHRHDRQVRAQGVSTHLGEYGHPIAPSVQEHERRWLSAERAEGRFRVRGDDGLQPLYEYEHAKGLAHVLIGLDDQHGSFL